MMQPLNARVVEWIGFVAAGLTTSAFLPQLRRIVQLQSAREISMGTFLMYTVGVMLWFVYGVSLRSMPMILSNSLGLGVSIAILYLKVKYDRRGAKKELLG
jgi:MtN3 and saliva related transmembrane protein